MVAGLWESFDLSMDYRAAHGYLEDMGIEYVNRQVDDLKKYEASITVDMTADVDMETSRHVSIRGTVAEGNIMVARINEFDKLYFEPRGHTVFFLYDDRPGVVGVIGAKLAAGGINIVDIRHPHDPESNRSLAIMKVDQPVPAALVDEIRSEIKAHAAFTIKL
jgi:D-3-phosphoglycerate dehydrogenase